ncbi:MAG: AAA family ATPase [Merdibacter sp.]
MKEPLAYRMRPQTLDEVIGQQHLIGKHGVLRRCAEEKTLFSMIFYGAPGMGKTTLAIVLANESISHTASSMPSTVQKELDTLFAEAKMFPGFVLIVDEVHRLNKDKQDLLLPHVENGSITLIGATTANPAQHQSGHPFPLSPL